MYRELAAPAELRQYVQCFWVHAVGPDEPARVHRILPDGCIDVISGLDAEPAVVGPMTRHALVGMEPGTVIVGARFKPGLAPALLRCSSPELLDLEPSLSEVWPEHTAGDLACLAEGTLEDRFIRLRTLLATRLAAAAPDLLVEAAAEALRRDPDTPVARLSERLGMSSRQLLRRFELGVGYGPSFFRRVVRLQLVVHSAALQGSGRLAHVAANAGYADQAHMNRDVRQLAGVTAGELLDHRAEYA
jgi:AraC-like DNA-binding protein